MRKLVIIAAVCLALAACKDEDGRTVAELNYLQDKATGFCYAIGYESMGRVKCTKSVLAIADKDVAFTDYFLDPQTELCFVTGFNSLAGVPCNDFVNGKIAE